MALLAPFVLVAGLLVMISATRTAAAAGVLRQGFPATTALSEARPAIPQLAGPSKPSGWFRTSSPTLADLYGNGQKEIIIGSQDGQIYVYYASGRVVWKRYLDAPSTPAGAVAGAPAVGDIDGDGLPEIVAADENGWVFAWDVHGNLKPGWPRFTGNVNDVNANQVNCAQEACSGVVAGPTVADIDGDGHAEVIVGAYSHLLWVFEGDGSTRPGWPRNVWDGIGDAAAVGDLNGDGIAEIVVGSDVANDCANCAPYGALKKGGLVHAFEPDGTELPGWPFPTDSFVHGSPVIANLDGVGNQREVIVGSGYFPNSDARGHYLYAINADGSTRWGFRTQGILEGAPAVGDINGDGRPEIAVDDVTCLSGNTGCVGGAIYLLSQHGSQVGLDWKNTDLRNTNGGALFGGPVLADINGDGQPDVVAADANFGVRGIDSLGRTVFTAGTRWSNYGTPAVGDLDGSGTNEIVVGSAAGNGTATTDPSGAGQLWAWNTPGRGGLVFPQFQSRVEQATFRAPSAPGTVCAGAAGAVNDLPSVRRGGVWYLRASYSSGPASGCFSFGDPGDIPVTGNFAGNGTQTVGVFRPATGVWYLRTVAGGGAADMRVRFGSPGDIPVTGDWTGTGRDTIGVFRPTTGTWYLSNSLTSGRADVIVSFGSPGDVPVVGDWHGGGITTVGVFRPNTATWFLTDRNTPAAVVSAFRYGSPSDIPVVGDWDHNGTSTFGVFRNGTWYLTNSLSKGSADGSLAFGSPGDVPLIWGWR